MRAIAVPVAIAALALAGCGGGGSSSGSPKQAVQDYLAAFTSANGAKACSLMTKQTRDQFVARISALTQTGDCATAVNKLAKQVGPQVLGALKKAKVGKVSVQGDNAKVQLTSGPHSTDTLLKKEGGEWKVTAVPGTQ
jgi:hypothetical protein